MCYIDMYLHFSIHFFVFGIPFTPRQADDRAAATTALTAWQAATAVKRCRARKLRDQGGAGVLGGSWDLVGAPR